MKIRDFSQTDIPELINLFRNTVRVVCSSDYNSQQILAWAPDEIDSNSWTKRFLNSFTLVAVENDLIIGFANLENNGTIDMLYVHAEWQRRGVGKFLLNAIEFQAKKMKLNQISSDVSITAKSFFLNQGFKTYKEYTKTVRGEIFRNTLMSKNLESNGLPTNQ